MAARKPHPQSLCHVGTIDQSYPTASARLARQPSRASSRVRQEHEYGLAPLRVRGLERDVPASVVDERGVGRKVLVSFAMGATGLASLFLRGESVARAANPGRGSVDLLRPVQRFAALWRTGGSSHYPGSVEVVRLPSAHTSPKKQQGWRPAPPTFASGGPWGCRMRRGASWRPCVPASEPKEVPAGIRGRDRSAGGG